jgi:hypothetical protein
LGRRAVFLLAVVLVLSKLTGLFRGLSRVSHAKAIETLDRYLDYRTTPRLRTTDDPGRYRGLEPASKLISTFAHCLQVSQKRLEEMFRTVP